MDKISKKVAVACLFGLFFFPACSVHKNCSKNKPYCLSGTMWEMQRIEQNENLVKLPKDVPTLQFEGESQLNGFTGCNRFFGVFEEKADGGLLLSPAGSTKMFCIEAAEVEYIMLHELSKITRYSVDKKTLSLASDDGSLKMLLALKK